MRSIGLPEVLIILGLLVLLFGGSRLPGLMGRLGRKLRSALNQLRWIWQSLAGSEDEEIRAEETVGRDEAARFLEHMRPVGDEHLRRRVAVVGERLARTRDAAARHFFFHVVDGPVANAYAFPGGYVFVTRRLAELCEDDEEIAFLLGHEMGHILCRHFAENKVMTALLGALKAGRLATELLGKGYSQQQEHEADLKGLELIRQADLPGDGALRLLRKFHQLAPGLPEFTQYFSTHPTATARMESVSSALAASPRRHG